MLSRMTGRYLGIDDVKNDRKDTWVDCMSYDKMNAVVDFAYVKDDWKDIHNIWCVG